MHNKTTTEIDIYAQMRKNEIRVKRAHIICTEVKRFVTPTAKTEHKMCQYGQKDSFC